MEERDLTKTTLQKVRVEEIDILKAFGIITMVAGHAGAPFSKFFYLFHMPVFFMASGFFFKDKTSDSFKGVIKSIISKIKTLWAPFVIWNSIYVLFHNIFLKINVYTNNPQFLVLYPGGGILQENYSLSMMAIKILKSIIFLGREQLSAAFWFLSTLFTISVLYCLFDYFIKIIVKNAKVIISIQALISVIFLIFGYYCSLHKIKLFSMDRVFSCYWLYLRNCQLLWIEV